MTRITETEAYKTPIPTKLNRESIFKIAEGVASNLQYKPSDKIHNVVERLGGVVEVKDFWAEGSLEGGSLEARAKNDFTIYVPLDTSEVRDRFTIAHELGHYFLHYLWPQREDGSPEFKLRASRYGSDRAEWEANWFASAFLMPSEEFLSVVKNNNLSSGQIAKHFSVSLRAVEIRAKVLGVNV